MRALARRADSCENAPMPIEIQTTDVKKLQESGTKFVLLDVRQPEEVSTAAIEGALCIPMNEVMYRLDELDPAATVVVFCHLGGRSAHVSMMLQGRGFKDVRNMTGGIHAWAMSVDPSVPMYDYDGRSIRVHPRR